MTDVTFDTALPLVVSAVLDIVDPTLLTKGEITFLRDATGRLIIVLKTSRAVSSREHITKIASKFTPYMDTDSVSTPEELFDDTLNSDDVGTFTTIDLSSIGGHSGDISVLVVDRRIVGVDWLQEPLPAPVQIPTAIFASVKGGVGRSTALAVTASALAADGLNVLAIDLDLEAPGIGSALLGSEELPLYGSLDFFVETNVRKVTPDFVSRMIAPSPLTQGRGLISVIPATGLMSLTFPENVVSKIARAYLEKPNEHIPGHTFLHATRSLISEAASTGRYDVVLVDARAGLHESTATSLLGLGATILLFGVDTPQTFEGYEFLFAAMKQVRGTLSGEDWRSRLRMIHAKASADQGRQKAFRDRCFELLSDAIYEEAEPDDVDAFNFDLDDPTAPHFAWPILSNETYLEFDPLATQEQLDRTLYEASFGTFIAALRAQMGV